MRVSSRTGARSRTVVAAVLGGLLVGGAVSPAYADSIRSQQWHLDVMGAEDIWKVSTGKGVTVAVIDTGVDGTNPDLQGQVLKGKDLAPKESGNEQSDPKGHGTSMAGLIAGTGKSGGGDGAFGLAPGAKILPIRLRDAGWDSNRDAEVGEFNTTVSMAIRHAADSGARVINISMSVREGSQKMEDSVAYALGKGALVFASTGNGGDSSLSYPAATPGVVAVGAVGKDLKKTDESQWGPQVDFAAPGMDMVHACKTSDTGLCKSHGTSDATAIASAAAALIWSKRPEWNNNQVLRAMLNTAGGPTSGNKRNDYVGYGAIRPLRAINTPGDLGPADEYPLPDLVAAESKSPSPSAEASKAAGGAADDKEDAKKPVAASDDAGNTGLWIGLGVGAAALLGGAVAIPVIRSRRRVAAASAAPVAPAPAYAPYPPVYAPPQPGQGQGDPRNAPPGPGH
ncbi:type VII secretion-associated serine protease mycosin [Streptomyces sp. JV176]|uniref:type VII secretion-associated serine protease mycosin n=1 Tax=unclassified Streptomyces TaxID=2593676 RepID=UPI002E7A71FB|nr:type VII secretion-associated serine protease mycosin [Streptomyces sp. JV176]MEE1802338.1 type VII secretion-associated serine protease mycosin [Streptomyces sp. JV176]